MLLAYNDYTHYRGHICFLHSLERDFFKAYASDNNGESVWNSGYFTCYTGITHLAEQTLCTLLVGRSGPLSRANSNAMLRFVIYADQCVTSVPSACVTVTT
ncbi:MAG: hypothetical protein ACI9SB_000007 [Candidatus Azotimanducaceae bacterium]|jgi:hypothetical protein